MTKHRTKSGRILDDEAVDHLAEEAEKGYDLTDPVANPLRGRPSLSGKGTSPRINVRLSEDMFERAKAVADAEGRRVSEVARTALEAYIQQEARTVRTQGEAVEISRAADVVKGDVTRATKTGRAVKSTAKTGGMVKRTASTGVAKPAKRKNAR